MTTPKTKGRPKGSKRSRGESIVMSIRLPADVKIAVDAEAEAAGMETGTYIRKMLERTFTPQVAIPSLRKV